MFQPHFLHFSIGKAAISLKDKAPRSPQQRFSGFSTWIREQDPPDLPFSYFTQIGGSMGRGVRFFDFGDFLRFLLFIVPKYGTGMG